MPLALAVTAGIVFDRLFGSSLGEYRWAFYALTAAAALLAWVFSRAAEKGRLGLVYVGLTVAALAALYHDARLHRVAPDDVSVEAEAESPPTVRVRGDVEDEPLIYAARRTWSPPAEEGGDGAFTLRSVLRVTAREREEGWVACSGRVQLVIAGRDAHSLPEVHLGDELEVEGRLVPVRGASNPGEHDVTEFLQSQGIRSALIAGPRQSVTYLGHHPPPMWLWPEVGRWYALRALSDGFPFPDQDKVRGLAAALLLGEDQQLSPAEWETYKRTGVVHALAVSGQHLAILGGFLWLVLRVCRVRRRPGALIVALVLLAYALLTGGRPPILRAAVMVCAFCGGVILRRPSSPPNDFALAWLAVALWNPADVFGIGCQLSFLAVALLYWGVARWFRYEWFREPDALQQLIDEARPRWLRVLRRVGWWLVQSYLVSAVIWLGVLPLVLSRYNLAPIPALLIGPPVVLLTSVALVAGFAALPVMLLCPPLAPLAAWPTSFCLWLCQGLVHAADEWSLGPWFFPSLPDWWLWVFYGGLLSALLLASLRQRWRWLLLGGVAWLCVGLLLLAWPRPPELRCTFLAVGQGGCAVLETPDGRTILYDAGSMHQPDVARTQIVPFLRSRGVRKVDEVILSHADADHFNGLAGLLKYVPVGQVTRTPSFSEKPTAVVRDTLAALDSRGVPVRVVKAGDRLVAGAVEMTVLHPPEEGPAGNENARSLVLLVEHEGHRILLTGDVSGPGLERVLSRPTDPIDVLQAPHHGSRTSNTPGLAAWARPRWVVSCQGPPRNPRAGSNPYETAGAEYLTTWERGAVTVRSGPSLLSVETFTPATGTAPRASRREATGR